MTSLIISAENITIRNGEYTFFAHTSWDLHKKEQWLFVGPNGAGKSTFAKALAGLLPLKYGKIILHTVKTQHPYPSVHKGIVAYISFESQTAMLWNDNLKRDLESYMGVEKKGTKVKDFLSTDSIHLQDFGWDITVLLDRELATLSTGEMRKIFLIKVMLTKPEVLIVDEPFDGLDKHSQDVLQELLSKLMHKTQIILITHREDEIPKGITHIMQIKDGKISSFGTKQTMMKFMLHHTALDELQKVYKNPKKNSKESPILIKMSHVTVSMGGKIVLADISWTVRKGEKWVIVGKNGAGKSTLMKLITGDNQQAYGNNIMLFGKKKQELSLWEIKKQIGIVSSDVMMSHAYHMSSYNVILSGFFDSIGLYSITNKAQKSEAMHWIKLLRIEHLISKDYLTLSFGQKRIVLIARALVKSPEILVLDEPCNGLDRENRKQILTLLAQVAKTDITMLYITHHKNEVIPRVTHMLELSEGKVI